MKKFSMFCVAVFVLFSLAACAAPTLDTSDNKAYVNSLKVMYDDLSKREQSQFLGAISVVLLSGKELEIILQQLKGVDSLDNLANYDQIMQLYPSLSQIPDEKKMLEEMKALGSEAAAGAAATMISSTLASGKAMFINLKSLNGLTAAKITEKGTTLLKELNQE